MGRARSAPSDYRAFGAAAHARGCFEDLADLGVPSIHFGVGTGELLDAMRDAGGDVIGVDWRVPLDAAWERVGARPRDPGQPRSRGLLAPWDVVEREAHRRARPRGGRDGHIFNLGHGVLPATPVENLQRLVDLVHERPKGRLAERSRRSACW